MRLLRSTSLLATCFVCILACVSVTLDVHAQSFGLITTESPCEKDSDDKENPPVRISHDCLLHSLDVVEEIESESKTDTPEKSSTPAISFCRNRCSAPGTNNIPSRSMRRWILYCAMKVDC